MNFSQVGNGWEFYRFVIELDIWRVISHYVQETFLSENPRKLTVKSFSSKWPLELRSRGNNIFLFSLIVIGKLGFPPTYQKFQNIENDGKVIRVWDADWRVEMRATEFRILSHICAKRFQHSGAWKDRWVAKWALVDWKSLTLNSNPVDHNFKFFHFVI